MNTNNAHASAVPKRTVMPLFALFVVFALSLLRLTYRDGAVGIVADDSVYLLMTDLFSPYFPELSARANFIANISRYPPLYPAFMALLGASSETVGVAHLATASCLALSVWAYFYWLKFETEHWLHRLVLAALFALLPATFLYALELWSEHLYLLISLLVLATAARARQDELRWWLMAAALVGLAALTRTVGVALVAALAIYVFINKPPRRWLIIAVAFAVPLILFLLGLLDRKSDDYAEQLSAGYSKVDLFASLQFVLSTNLSAMWTGWAETFAFVPTRSALPVVSLLLALAVFGLLVRLRKTQLDAFYVVIYLGIIALWPAEPVHSKRFLFVLQPIILFYVWTGIRTICDLLKRPQYRVVGGALIAVL
ncbi:MAG: hypothetical protein HOI95_30390, partial [Chromatiales bacterium]|nr:hypothetical protein [Chromatiales bacterium]